MEIGEPTPERPLEQQLAGVALERHRAAEHIDRQSAIAHAAAEVARREFDAVPRRIAWLVASPAVLGGMLLIFLVVAWGVLDHVETSGTTSTALVVAALLLLVPAVLAALRGTTAAEHAQQVFQQTEAVFSPPDDNV